MNDSTMKVATLGECMVELTCVESNLFRQAFAGDTLNTALYLSRLLDETDEVFFISAVGTDQLSKQMVEFWRSESIRCDYIFNVADKLPGLYRVTTDATGERTFEYWRNDSAARKLFYCDKIEQLKLALEDFDALFISGISVAILDTYSRKQLLDLLDNLKKTGVKIYFDPNYRRALWADVCQAQKVLNQFAKRSDVILPSYDDEKLLDSDITINGVIEKYYDMGIEEIVLKNGNQSCFILTNSEPEEVVLSYRVTPIDTTGAGDSFNAGYIAGRSNQKSVSDSVQLGNQLAAKVVTNPGAIIDKNKMP